MRGSHPQAAMLLRTRSVHGFGMVRPFLAVGLTDDLRVMVARVVNPGRIAYFPGCRWVLELPADAQPPSPGLVLEMSDG